MRGKFIITVYNIMGTTFYVAHNSCCNFLNSCNINILSRRLCEKQKTAFFTGGRDDVAILHHFPFLDHLSDDDDWPTLYRKAIFDA